MKRILVGLVFMITHVMQAMNDQSQTQLYDVTVDSEYRTYETFNANPVAVITNQDVTLQSYTTIIQNQQKIKDQLNSLITAQGETKIALDKCHNSIKRYTSCESILILTGIGLLGIYITAVPYVYKVLYE